MNELINVCGTNILVTINGVTCEVIPGGRVVSPQAISYTGVSYPTENNTRCTVLVGVDGVTEGLRYMPRVGFQEGLNVGFAGAFAFACALLFLRGAKGFFRSYAGGE